MAENLAYLPSVSPPDQGSVTQALYYVYDYSGTDVSEAKRSSIYAEFGVLYNWAAAENACPTGWHLPSKQEWEILLSFVGSNAGKKLKSTSGWINPDQSTGNGTNTVGFNGLAAGQRLDLGYFQALHQFTFFWNNTAIGISDAAYTQLSINSDAADKFSTFRRMGFSVRCIRD